MSKGSLVVVGIGIKVVGHITLEAQAFIRQAEKVLYVVTNEPIADWIHSLNSTAESLEGYYADNKLRLETYREMVDHMIKLVRQGLQVCVVYYGHPGVLVTAAHIAIRQARQEGFLAWMLPGISAEDCLLADLFLDPAQDGLQSFEATSFLLQKRQVDTASGLILWQVGIVGVLHHHKNINITHGLHVLTEYLLNFYDPNHEIILYEASAYPTIPPLIHRLPLAQLPIAAVTGMSTLYISPKTKASYDLTMMKHLGIDPADLGWKPDKNKTVVQ